MKPFILSFLFSLFIGFLQNEDWKLFQSLEGKFKIEVPAGTMEKKERKIYTDIGVIDYFTYYYQNPEKDFDNALYIVSYCDYPESTIHSDSTMLLNDFFDNTIEAANKSVFGELRYTEDVRYKDYPGKFFRIDYRAGTATLKSKTFLVENRFYNIQIATTKGKSLNTAADRFFDSFKLIND